MSAVTIVPSTMLADAIVIAVGNAPVASFERAIAAEALTLAFVIVPSAIALRVTALAPISFDVIVPTLSFPATSASVVLPETIASLVNNVWSMMLFINVLVIT